MQGEASMCSDITSVLSEDCLHHVLMYCGIVELEMLSKTSFTFRNLPYMPLCTVQYRRVINAIDRIITEPLRSPWWYSSREIYDEEPLYEDYYEDYEEYSWSSMMSESEEYSTVLGLNHPRHERIDLEIRLHYQHATGYNINFSDYEERIGFFLLALHSDEIAFAKGYSNFSAPDDEVVTNSYPPRGKLPRGRKWNYVRGGTLP